jgi:hypothetical protein
MRFSCVLGLVSRKTAIPGIVHNFVFLISIIAVLLAAASAFAGWSEPRLITEPGGVATPHIIAQGDTLHVVGELANPQRIGYWQSTDGGGPGALAGSYPIPA